VKIGDANVPIKNWLISLSVVVAMAVGAPNTWAQDEDAEGGEGAPVTSAIYIPMKPSFVVNFGGPGRLKYIKADITVRVKDTVTANQVRHHMPFLRNNIVLLLSAQTDEAIDTQQGKEILRQAALEEVHSVMAAEEGDSGVVDLYFDNFIVQR
jgi:flagellar FliL protein